MTDFSPSQKKKYLSRVLAMNPVHQAGQIMALRNQMLGIQSRESAQLADGSRRAELRARVKQQIENVREQMWRQNPQQLAKMLNSIDVSQLPEQKSAVERLKLVIRNHQYIWQLSDHPKQHINLTNTFRRVVMLPPKESGALKEAYLRQIIESGELGKIKSMVRMLQTDYPQLYAMEEDWLESILSLKARKRPSGGGASAAESYESGVPGWLIWIGFLILFRIIAAVMRN